METIFNLDTQLFYWINHGWSNDILDYFFMLFRNKYTWIPLYLFILSFVAFNFGKKFWWFLLFSLLTIGLSDNLSSKLIKPTFKRDRPCRVLSDAQVLVRCGSGYSFTSSHATNHFAVGTFFMLAFGFILKKWKYLFLLWAGLISIGQVYVGVHYPLDILVGAILGYLCGAFVFWVYRHKSLLEKREIIA